MNPLAKLAKLTELTDALEFESVERCTCSDQRTGRNVSRMSPWCRRTSGGRRARLPRQHLRVLVRMLTAAIRKKDPGEYESLEQPSIAEAITARWLTYFRDRAPEMRHP